MSQTEQAPVDAGSHPASAKGPLVQVRDVSLSYWLKGRNPFRRQKFWALKHITFDLYPGESLGVVGKNGAGKSTLLQLLSGAVGPDSGTVTLAPHTKASLLTLKFGLLPNLSGRENAIQGLLFQGWRTKEVGPLLENVKEYSELGDFFDQPVNTYSSGMRARLLFSVAIQIQPDIMLVDEVLAVGDKEFRAKALATMREWIRSGDQTVVIASHSQGTIKNLCDRVIWIDKGELKMDGDCESVLEVFNAKQPGQEAVPAPPDDEDD